MKVPDPETSSASLFWNAISVLLPAAILLWAGVGWWQGRGGAGSDPGRAARINCDIQNGPCVRPLGEGRVRLDIDPRPVRAMVEHRFRIVLEDIEADATPRIDLDMPDMDMGYNRVVLRPAGENAYAGTGVFPVCPTGIPTWSAEVVVPGAGTAEFLFDVRY